MKRDRLTPRNQWKKVNRSVSPHNVPSKSKLKNCFPATRQTGKENDPHNSKNDKSLKICLDLASYHQKESQMLKAKNTMLEQQLKDQMKDMEELRSELSKIKVSISGGATIRKEYDQLKTENADLRKDNDLLRDEINTLVSKTDQLTQEIISLRVKGKQTQSILIDTNKKSDYDLNPLSFAKESRRQEYANKYQSITFVPSMGCLECRRKENQLDDAKNKYSDELRFLQEHVTAMQRSQTAVEVMQKQLISKNQCIDYLVTQLNLLESDSKAILHNMGSLQVKLRDVTAENVMLKAQIPATDRLYGSFTKSVA